MTEQDHFHDAISSVEDIIEDARNGRMYILVDHEDRENEGDLIIPAQMANADAINFMAMYGRGLICLALTGERIDRMELPLMAAANQSRHETAFTTSIEAREGVTTGISAQDRARTVEVAIDPDAGPQDIATPGHVFPLRSKDGGVLVRAGHTEAAVDISRLAGLDPSGVICEVMNDDGTMARLPDLIAFSQKHGIKIGTISDLIAYRRRHDSLVRETAQKQVSSEFGGDWLLRVFTDETEGLEHIALTKGDIATDDPVLVRMHAANILEDVFALNPGRSHQLHDAMRAIGEEGRGAVVVLQDMAAGTLSQLISPTAETSSRALRQYGFGAQILGALGVRNMVLLTNSPPPRPVALEGYGLTIVDTRPIPSEES